MFKKKIELLLTLVIVIVVNFFNIAAAQTTVDLKVLEKKWTEYIQALGTVEGIRTTQYKVNGKADQDHTTNFVCLYPLLIDSRGPHNDYDGASVFGRNYHFTLTKSEDKKWVIKNITCESSNKKITDMTFPVYLGSSWKSDPVGYQIFITLAVGLFGIDANVNLPYMISNENFVVKEFRKAEKNGIDGYILNFDFSLPDFPEVVKNDPDFANNKLKKFSLQGNLFLTTDYFLVAEGEFNFEYLDFTRKAKVNISYDKETYKVPLPRNYHQIIESTHTDNKKYVYEHTYSFDLYETNPKDRKRFTLSAYGLPEYECRTTQDIRIDRTRYILIGLGLLLTGLGILLIIRKRMKRQSELNDTK
jgi:hypothetical protein